MGDDLKDGQADRSSPSFADAGDAAFRTAALAERALREAEQALHHGLRRGVPADRLGALEESVRRARAMVDAARMASDGARGAPVLAPRAPSPRPPLAPVTWGRRSTTCGACGRSFAVRYRCTSHQPDKEAEVRCHAAACGATVRVRVPESAYAFSTRETEKP